MPPEAHDAVAGSHQIDGDQRVVFDDQRSEPFVPANLQTPKQSTSAHKTKRSFDDFPSHLDEKSEGFQRLFFLWHRCTFANLRRLTVLRGNRISASIWLTDRKVGKKKAPNEGVVKEPLRRRCVPTNVASEALEKEDPHLYVFAHAHGELFDQLDGRRFAADVNFLGVESEDGARPRPSSLAVFDHLNLVHDRNIVCRKENGLPWR